MLIEILTMFFAATGVFTGSVTCEKMANEVTLELNMRVESNNATTPSDSISKSLKRLEESMKASKFNAVVVVPLAGSEGKNSFREENESRKEYFAEKSLQVSSKNFQELSAFLKVSAQHGFLMHEKPQFSFTNKDSLESACVERATKIAIAKANAAKSALNGKSIAILKITDDDRFGVYTSDDDTIDGEEIDGFYYQKRYALGAGGEGYGLSEAYFYNIIPVPVKVSSTIKIFVKIVENE
jgi:hypothetical protein